ncbi:restriction endonuclease [Lysobacter sp. S4-A87]|uniref:restriction endonuclease n=1 Tax=Lysobacter sp. S4-A87 TaxID=2925843 RepID=UPI001F53D921|nr:restriction endonuclease [Lysobacter sp. S4-A87]UNK49518.1 restriction endonuclease [Lysobacter sp. S4-A87]
MKGLKPVTRRHDDALARVSWDQFEVLVAGYYRSQGYQVEHVGTGGTGRDSDGGIDLKLRRDDGCILVQCKRWTAMKVPHNAVHELLGIMVNQGATGAILITSGEFTKAAIEAASRQRNFKLIDGHELRVMLGPVPDSALDSLARLRGPATKLAGKAMSDLGLAVVAKLVLFGLFLILLILVAQHMQSVIRSLSPSVAPRPTTETPVSAQPSPATSPAVPATLDTCHEVIDKPSGTYIDHCASGKQIVQPTPERLREQRRRADEAIKVIAESTPEL